MKRKGSVYRTVYDKLKLERVAEDGGQFYNGNKGRYVFIFNLKPNGSAGKVIRNRQFLTSLFRPKHSEKFQTFVGDVLAERKYLVFQQTEKDEITIYEKNLKKEATQTI